MVVSRNKFVGKGERGLEKDELERSDCYLCCVFGEFVMCWEMCV